MTPEQSRAARAELGLSQRKAAELAGISRPYLNQFERERWIPTDEFLIKLSDFYLDQGAHIFAEPEQSNVEQDLSPGETGWDEVTDNLPRESPDIVEDINLSENDLGAGWQTVGEAVLVMGVIGAILLTTGNLPAVLDALKRAISRRQMRF